LAICPRFRAPTMRKRERRRRALEAGAFRPSASLFRVVPARPEMESPPRRRSRSAAKTVPVVKIRPAVVEDYEALSELLAEGDLLHSSALPEVFRRPEGPSRSRDYIESLIDSDNSLIMVAERTGTLVGAVQVLVLEAPTIPVMVPRRYAVVDNVVVIKGSRRAGIGRGLMEAAEHWAQKQGVSQIELNVWEFNRAALGFYRALGYRTASRRMRKTL
jgi:ribosomal protein S18 acetylase RimI-like enzyme